MKCPDLSANTVAQSTAALCLMALLMASGTPSAIAVQANCTKQVVCIAPKETPLIGYTKGAIEIRSDAGAKPVVKGHSIAAGDNIETGADGFAWVKLGHDRSYTIQPNSSTLFSASELCKRVRATSDVKPPEVKAAFLFAAVRG